MKKILVTGGLGFIGSHTVVELQQAGYEVVIIDNLYNSKIEVLDSITSITSIKPSYFNIDLRNKIAVEDFFKNNKIDGIIHFAASKAVGESVNNPLLYYENNINNNCIGIYNMDRETCFNMDTGAFIAVNDDTFAHKFRHMRSSYGRTGEVAIKINGNGRFSEMQAAEALTSLETDCQNNLSHNFTKAVSFASKFKYKANVIGENYTSPILIIKCPDHNSLVKIQIKLDLFNFEHESISFEIDKNDILIRVPLKPSLNDNLFSCLLSC